MKIIAKTVKGNEFCYSTNTAHAVSNSRAETICGILNRVRYKLSTPNEIWYIYDVDRYDLSYDYAQTQKFFIRKGILKEKRC